MGRAGLWSLVLLGSFCLAPLSSLEVYHWLQWEKGHLSGFLSEAADITCCRTPSVRARKGAGAMMLTNCQLPAALSFPQLPPSMDNAYSMRCDKALLGSLSTRSRNPWFLREARHYGSDMKYPHKNSHIEDRQCHLGRLGKL